MEQNYIIPENETLTQKYLVRFYDFKDAQHFMNDMDKKGYRVLSVSGDSNNLCCAITFERKD